MLDSGADRSFISQSLAARLGVTLSSESRTLRTFTGDSTVFQLATIQVQPEGFSPTQIEFGVLSTLKVDLILGRDWLALNNPEINWAQQLVHPRSRHHQFPPNHGEKQDRIVQCPPSRDGFPRQQEEDRLENIEEDFIAPDCYPPSRDGLPWQQEEEVHFNAINVESGKGVDQDHGDAKALGLEHNPERTDEELKKRKEVPQEGTLEDRSLEEEKRRLLRDYADVFDEKGPQWHYPPDFRLQHELRLRQAANPFAARPRRLSEREFQEFRKQLNEWLSYSWVERSSSPWRATPVFAKKKSGDIRICFNYRPLNERTEDDSYPLNDLRSLLNRLARKRWFTTLDAQKGFHQVAMEHSSKRMTAFWTPFGLYQWRVMPFGLKNAPATFQRTIDEVLGEVKGIYADVLMDDIVIFSETWEEHIMHVEDILSRLRRAHIFLEPSKCNLLAQSITYLGYSLNHKGLTPPQDKVEEIKHWPAPTSKGELQSFMGMANFLRDFIKDYQAYQNVFSDLLSSTGGFSWSTQHQQAFDALKQAMVSSPPLILPDPTSTFYVASDASDDALGAALMQTFEGRLRPIGFSSRRLNKTERRQDSFTHELCGIIFALRRWRPLLEGAKVVLFTDHKPLVKLNQENIGGQLRHSRWVETFIYEVVNLDLRIEYRPGRSEVIQFVDALSRRPSEARDQEIEHLLAIREFSQASCFFSPDIYQRDGNFSCDTWRERHGVLLDYHSGYYYTFLHGEQVVAVPRVESVILEILHEAHSAAGAGHPGIWATRVRVQSFFWWPDMDNDIYHFVKSCDICQRTKIPRSRTGGLTRPLPLPTRKGEIWHLDFFTGLPPLKDRFDSVLVMVERYSRFVLLEPVSSSCTSSDLITIFRRRILAVFGPPSSVVTDRGSLFTSRAWQKELSQLGAERHLATTGHPQSNGVAENAVGLAKEILKRYRTKRRWAEVLPEVMIALNSRPSRTSKVSPYYVLFGQTPPLSTTTGAGAVVGSSSSEGQHLSAFYKEMERIEDRRVKERKRMTKRLDKYRKQRIFQPGDEVLLDIRGIILPGQRMEGVLRDPFVGPFTVREAVGGNAYKLDIPSHWKIHDVVNVERLQRYIRDTQGQHGRTLQPGPVREASETAHGDPEYELEDIVSSRHRRDGGKEYLVRYAGWGPEEDQWRPEEELQGLPILQEFLQREG